MKLKSDLLLPGNKGSLCFPLLPKAAYLVCKIEEDLVQPVDGVLSNSAVMLLQTCDSVIRAAAAAVLNFL